MLLFYSEHLPPFIQLLPSSLSVSLTSSKQNGYSPPFNHPVTFTSSTWAFSSICFPFSAKKFWVRTSRMSAQNTHKSRTSPLSRFVYFTIGISKEITLYLFGRGILKHLKLNCWCHKKPSYFYLKGCSRTSRNSPNWLYEMYWVPLESNSCQIS